MDPKDIGKLLGFVLCVFVSVWLGKRKEGRQ